MFNYSKDKMKLLKKLDIITLTIDYDSSEKLLWLIQRVIEIPA